MPTETFDNNAFFLFDILGESEPGQPQCIQLDLSSTTDPNQPPNRFNLINLNTSNSQCNQVLAGLIQNPTKQAQIITEINNILGPIRIPIPEFDVLNLFGQKIDGDRLSHLVMTSMSLGWSAADSGSIVVLIELNELPGQHDIQGHNTYGDLTNAQLRIYLPVSTSSLDCRGQPVVSSVAVTFDYNLSLNTNDGAGLPTKPVRDVITDTVVNTVQAQLQATNPGQTENRASLLLQAVLAGLVKFDPSGRPLSAIPADTVFYDFAVANNSATIKWADTVRYARVTVDTVQPDHAGLPGFPGRLSLVLGAGYYRFALPPVPPPDTTNYCGANSSAAFGQRLPLPLIVSNVPLPDGIPLEVDITLTEQTIIPMVPVLIGHVHDWWTSPTYGASPHTDQNGPFVVTYQIEVQNQPF